MTNFGNNFNGTTVSAFAPGSATPTRTLNGLSCPRSSVDSSGNLYVINTNTNSGRSLRATSNDANFHAHRAG